MRFTMEIDCDNAAFADRPELEVARILADAADRLLKGRLAGPCMDANGNRVGSWRLAED